MEPMEGRLMLSAARVHPDVIAQAPFLMSIESQGLLNLTPYVDSIAGLTDSGYAIIGELKDSMTIQNLPTPTLRFHPNSISVEEILTDGLTFSLESQTTGLSTSRTAVFGTEPPANISQILPEKFAFDSHAQEGALVGSPLSAVADKEPDHEGGAISIEAVLESRKESIAGESSAATAPAPSRMTALAPELPRAARAVSSDPLLVGEWARAIVFEFAGGEPSPTVSHEDAVFQPESEEPAWLAEHAANHAPHSSPRAAIRSSADREEPKAGHEPASATPELGDAASAHLDETAFPSGHELGNVHTAAKRLASNQLASIPDAGFTSTPRVGDAARAVAIEQLPHDQSMNPLLLTADSSGWRHTAKATPLLVLWALERITADGTRRRRHDDRGPAPVERRSGSLPEPRH
jgi:hypothetical protein